MPYCEGCHACVSVRVLVDEFEPGRSMRRVIDKNERIVAVRRPPEPTSEQFALFRRYIDARHGDGGMADMTVLDYAMMVEDSHVETRIIEYRRRGVGLPYLYLGYWIMGSRKMSYKMRYQPQEQLGPNGWVRK